MAKFLQSRDWEENVENAIHMQDHGVESILAGELHARGRGLSIAGTLTAPSR